MNASPRRAVAALAAAALTAPLLLASASPASAELASPAKDASKLARKLVDSASADSAHQHLRKFQQIADTAGGNRAAGTLGYDASAAYVYQQLKKAGYDVSYQEFPFMYTETQAQKLAVVSPAPRDITVSAMTYTKSTPVGGTRAALAGAPVDADGSHGCEPADFAAGAFTGRIALIQRGGCAFAVKQANAAAAGAVGALVYNNVEGALSGTLGSAEAAKIPTGGISKADGEALASAVAAGPVEVNLELRQLHEQRTTRNVIAETRRGNAANTVMLGSHLDSVTAGPGISDNGSGSAGLLDVALKFAKYKDKTTNKVRFAWWGAEEIGLLGSEHYVGALDELGRKEIKLYLNFDMIASPNYGLFVYDGDDSDGVGAPAGPAGSAQLERDINAFLDRQGHPHEGTDFTGRSDYGPFVEVGIPSGGTFTGAEGIKTAAQAQKFGGTAGAPYDPCYHTACDDLDNIDMKAFDVNIDVIANAVGTYAHDLSSLRKPVGVVPTSGGEGSGGGLHDDHGHEATE
ncbi:M28 family metallopeptidase [Streptomyces somaliensis DSM 40738]|uniref:M28 family metallopeptidase n=1 Tax=Streptomyces somaliensis TaxID=78355 RepID=UPI0021C35A8B|nr:M28 family metallopeptidase [Streptomyces somaliensis]MCQ0024647.1 M28 family metallopeptidase [Streptomyces somaliensis DSM 40738]